MPISPRKLAEAMGIPKAEIDQFNQAVNSLRQAGQVVIDHKKNLTLPAMPHRVIGTFRASDRGFGFVVPLEPNSYGDLYVAAADCGGAMTDDVVVAKAVKRGTRNGQTRYAGIIIDIIERGHRKLVGTLQRSGDTWFVEPEGKGFFKPVLVLDAPSSGAQVNDKVVLEIVSYPRRNEPATAAIVQVLGKAGQYDAELYSVIAQYDLPTEFSEAARQQAYDAAQAFDPENIDKRADLTDQVVITIDPPDAKDFDDAISLTRTRDGLWQLGVHIADVSYFVPAGSPLDEEARRRGNSVYLPRKVLPMLPEVLSNGVCSLQPQQKRLTKSAFLTYDDAGNLMAAEFDNTMICSTARLTYQQADSILKGHTGGFDPRVVALLHDMERLARAIEARRYKNGMIHLELPEVELIYDKAGRVIDAQPADNSYPHTIIEMFMVEANEAVAGLLDRWGVPFMRRIHPDPDPYAGAQLGRFAKLYGMKVPRVLNRRDIQDLLAAVRGTPVEFAVNMHVLRSMQRAEYSPLHIGHFALASKHYCHFTSPIRRYADLLVHRLLQCYIEGKLNYIGLEEVLPEADLVEIGKHISFTEQQAEQAEEEIKTVLILQMLEKKIGMELDGVVTGLSNFGVFVQIRKFGIEGLIEPGDLGLDEWRYEQRSQAMVGRWSGKSVHLGQPMKVVISSVSLPARQLFLSPATPLTGGKSAPKTPKWLAKRNRK